MSYCKEQGKDKIIFVTKDDHTIPSKERLQDIEQEPGLILPDGSINWSCPCLGGMVAGPCGYQFKETFSCFHNSKAEPKGSDCFEEFYKFQDCLLGHPDLYGKDDEAASALEELNKESEKEGEILKKS